MSNLLCRLLSFLSYFLISIAFFVLCLPMSSLERVCCAGWLLSSLSAHHPRTHKTLAECTLAGWQSSFLSSFWQHSYWVKKADINQTQLLHQTPFIESWEPGRNENSQRHRCTKVVLVSVVIFLQKTQHVQRSTLLFQRYYTGLNGHRKAAITRLLSILEVVSYVKTDKIAKQ